jgi:hypothetical protein
MSERTSDALSDALDRIEALEERIGVMAEHLPLSGQCPIGMDSDNCPNNGDVWLEAHVRSAGCERCWREWGTT